MVVAVNLLAVVRSALGPATIVEILMGDREAASLDKLVEICVVPGARFTLAGNGAGLSPWALPLAHGGLVGSRVEAQESP